VNKNMFRTQLTDVTTTPYEELGVLRREIGSPYGERLFRYVYNGSGGTLTKDEIVAWEGLLGSAVSNTGTGTTYATRGSGSFLTDGVQAGNFIVVIDDAGAAGAAPEGEYSVVTKVSALRVDFSPALSVALANGDTVNFIRPWAIIAGAAGQDRNKVAGVVMADIATGSYGWIQTRGLYPSANMVAAGTAITAAQNQQATSAVLTPTTDAYDPIAIAMQTLSSDTVRRKAIVKLWCE
jgi:hypothetical protein